MSVVLSAVVPVFATVALGYGLARGGLFNQAVGTSLIRFMYFLAIPAMLFRALATTELPATVPWTYLLAFYGPSLVVFSLAAIALPKFLQWRANQAGIAGMTAAYSNMFLLGLPLTLSVFGPNAELPMFILLATQSTLLFPLTTFVVEAGGPASRAQLDTLKRLILNPILLSMLLGVSCNLSGITVPQVCADVLRLLSAAAPGCALVALGITLAGHKLAGGLGPVFAIVLFKNAIHPALVWLACWWLAVPSGWLGVAVLLAAMPCGVNALIFARQYGMQESVVSKAIVLSTVVSMFTATGLVGYLSGVR